MTNCLVTSIVCSVIGTAALTAARPMVSSLKDWGNGIRAAKEAQFQEVNAAFGMDTHMKSPLVPDPVPTLTGTDELPDESVSTGTSTVVYSDSTGTSGTATVSVTMSSGTACVVYTDAATGVTGTADIQ